MIRLAAATAICVTLLMVFMLGVFAGQAVLIMSSLCLWTPACVFLGFAIKPIRLRIEHEAPRVISAQQGEDGMRQSRLNRIKKPAG